VVIRHEEVALRSRQSFAAVVLLACAGHASAQAIYSCVDAKGRHLTADRPIMDCLDREQQVRGGTGTVRGKLGPSLTAEERAVEEEKARRQQEEQLRAADQKRRDRSLLARYPDEDSHHLERRAAVLRVNEAMASGNQRLGELQAERKQLQAQHAKGGDAAQQTRLQRLLDLVDQDEAAQRRLLASQAEERRRIDGRFDEELAHLRPQWAERVAARGAADLGAPAAGASAAPAGPQASAVRRPASAAAAR
jgi:hypothetical protein